MQPPRLLKALDGQLVCGQFFQDYMHFRVTDPTDNNNEEEYHYGAPEQPEEE